MWDKDEPISLTVKQVKMSLGNDLKDRIWRTAYHVFGDAKFGAAEPLIKTVFYPKIVQSGSPSIIQVNIPDYKVNEIDGDDHIEIPGGFEYFEIGRPLVPCYSISRSYPKGYQIQDVQLEVKSNPFNISGLKLPDSILTLPETNLEIISTREDDEWWPIKDYDWTVYQNPDNSTLVITMYPFLYNSQNGEAKFYDKFEFFINYTTSNYEITQINTDKHDYALGEPVNIDLEIQSNKNSAEDVIINTIFIDENTGEIIGGLELITLKQLKGNASYSSKWSNIELETGNYIINVELRDMKGNLLDNKIKNIRLGVGSGEILNLSTKPESYLIGDIIQTKMKFKNNGSIEISGTAFIKIGNATHIIQKIEYPFSNLLPNKTIEFMDEWKNTQENTTKIIGYVMYEGETTNPFIQYISEISKTPEPSPVPTPEPTQTPKPGGIPGYTTESIFIGLVIGVIILWMRARNRAFRAYIK
jgi:hypothetical protein